MHSRRPTELMKTLLTPRKIAWILVVTGIAYFIYVSPKTPVEFFDATMRDEAAICELKVEKNKMTDPAGAAASREIDELMSCKHRMDRIALLYDLTNNPQRVDSEKYSVFEAGYSTDQSTEAALRANNESYRATEQELKRRRKDILSRQRASTTGESEDTPMEQKVFDAAVFRMELEMSLLRRFQAGLFWRNSH
jgi:hypothetical protein